MSAAALAFLFLINDLDTTVNSVNRTTLRPTATQAAMKLTTQLPDPVFDAELYSVIAARPVFVASRRPPPPVALAAPTAAAQPPIDFALVGVIMAPNAKFGVIRMDGASEAITIRKGDNVGGWYVSDIGNSNIVLKWKGTVEVIKIAP